MDQHDLEYLIRLLDAHSSKDADALRLAPAVCRAISDELKRSRDRQRILIKLRDAFRRHKQADVELRELAQQLEQIDGDDTATDAFKVASK